jgi:porphyrinogen peroxidase
MRAWSNLPTEEQEKVIGRYKTSDIEMADGVKPANSHSALAGIEDENGGELKIVRDNMPFGNPAKGEIGTYFIAYASTFSTTHKMLQRMFIGDPPAIMTGYWISVRPARVACSSRRHWIS